MSSKLDRNLGVEAMMKQFETMLDDAFPRPIPEGVSLHQAVLADETLSTEVAEAEWQNAGRKTRVGRVRPRIDGCKFRKIGLFVGYGPSVSVQGRLKQQKHGSSRPRSDVAGLLP